MTEFASALLANGTFVSSQAAAGTQFSRTAEQNRQKVLDHGEDAVLRDLHQLLKQPSAQASKVLKAVFVAIRTTTYGATVAPSDAAACNQLRKAMFNRLPQWLQDVPADEQQLASDVTSVYSAELEHLSAQDTVQLLYACLAAMEEDKPHCCTLLELVPQCLPVIAAASSAITATGEVGRGETGDASEPTGASQDDSIADAVFYRDAAVSRILHSKNWHPDKLGQLLQVLKSIPMTKEQAEKAIKKTVNVCRTASLQQLPPVLYQLLLLSATAGTRSTALLGLTKLFDHLERQPQNQQTAVGALGSMPSRTLLQIEATLLMHISTLLKYDSALGNEWLKWLKANISANQFLLQVACTMSRHHKLEQPVQQLLKKFLQQACEAQALEGSGNGCRWLANISAVSRGPTLQDLEQGLLKAVRCSEFASELVCPGLLQLASSLMSTPCSCPLQVIMAARQANLPPHASPAVRAIRLGMLLMQEVFQVHADARGQVLRTCQGQLSCSNLDSALPQVLLLSSICRDQPALLSSYIPQLKDCLSSFAGLSADAALVLLLALWPLCRVRSDLQDHVIMLLRKMMYRQDVGGRLVAIRGFLCLILQQLADAPAGTALGGSDASMAGCSQASLSQISSLSGSGGVNLLQELSVVLKRALRQQAPVREALYKGLLQISAADPSSHELLCELLLPHLRSYLQEDDEQLPPLQLQRCADVVQGEPVLLEPLPVLLTCARRLASAQPAAASGDWNTGTAENSSSALQVSFSSIRSQLGQCQLEHFDLGGPADLSPLTPGGLLAQLHANNLLGALEVIMEDVVMEADKLKQEQEGKLAASEVTRLGEELSKLFDLHKQVYSLAVEGSKMSGKKGKKKGAAADDSGEQQPTAGQKRSKPSSSFTSVQKLVPQMSASCLALLCDAIVDDGLLQLPDDADVNLVDQHVQLARDACFRSFVLRSCANLLEDAQSSAASAALLDPKGETTAAPAVAEVLQLGPVLVKVVKLIMLTACPGGRSAGSVDKAEAHSDSLEQLSATALLQLLKLADATQQLAALFDKLPLQQDEQQPEAPAQQQDHDAEGSESPAAISAAIVPRLPQLEQCISKLMENSCFKEAHTAAECLMLLGRHLGSSLAAQDSAAAAADAGAAAGQQQQKDSKPAFVMLSHWAETALQQDEPEVKSVALAKILLDMYMRFAPNDLAAVKTVVVEIQALVGDTDQDQTQATQQHGTVLPLLTGTKTAQPGAAAPMAYVDECLGQIERILAGNLKAGVVQDGDSTSAAQERQLLARQVSKRLHDLLECVAVMVNTIFAMPQIVDQQVRILVRAYKLLAALAKAYQLPKAAVAAGKTLSKEFEDLVGMVHKDLTHRVYHFITDEQEAQRGMKVNINRIKREAKLIPALVFNIETWEKQLVATGRAVSKNLLKDARRATCRDFKINDPELKAAAAAAAAAAAGRSAGGSSGKAAGGSSDAAGDGGGGAPSGSGRRSSQQQSGLDSGVAAEEGDEEVEVQESEEQEEAGEQLEDDMEEDVDEAADD